MLQPRAFGLLKSVETLNSVSNNQYFSSTRTRAQGLYIIFQMDWKLYIITLAKILILPSSLRPEVYPEMSDSTALY